MNQAPGPGSIFINGKAQIAEMLQYMTLEEKQRLLKHIRSRNPTLAEEIEKQSFSFQDVFRLPDNMLKILLQQVQAPIIGIAIRGVPTDVQRKVLSLAARPYAEEAFKWMMAPLGDEKRDVKRAQEKILGVVGSWPRGARSQFNA